MDGELGIGGATDAICTELHRQAAISAW
ncbi:MAG: hypothetical protein ACJASK_001223 [Ilumatobacter sp.]